MKKKRNLKLIKMPKEDSTQFDGPLYESVDKDKKYHEA